MNKRDFDYAAGTLHGVAALLREAEHELTEGTAGKSVDYCDGIREAVKALHRIRRGAETALREMGAAGV